MEHIYTAKADDARELIVDLDLKGDLHMETGRGFDMTDEQDAAYVAEFSERYLASLAAVAEEFDVTVWVSYDHEQCSAGYDEEQTELVRQIWQAAHDRTPSAE